MKRADPLTKFHAPVGAWFRRTLGEPTEAQRLGWKAIAGEGAALIVAPTGSGKTLAAFLTALDGLMFGAEPAAAERLRVLYVSPLKALGVDVERNLQAPLLGIAEEAERLGTPFRRPTVAVRTGDTPPSERARFRRRPADILITTPESLYLLLTSQARARLASVDTVIVDEIHAVAGTKRGTHLATSLERLEDLRRGRPPLKRIGLSATIRPLDAAARFLAGGIVASVDAPHRPRPYVVVDARAPKALDLEVTPPLDEALRAGDAAKGPGVASPSYWPAAYPLMVERIRAHRATIVFVNSRRSAERVAAGINVAAGEDLARAHHGSMAKELRAEAEGAMKRGELPCLVATSTLELGIDMGAVDLVLQIEAPPSIASGLQRVGRAGHRAGETSKGVVFPKFRHDLLLAAAATRGMFDGAVEETRFPKNALDVLAQQIVAEVAVAPRREDDLYVLFRRAAPYAELPRAAFDGVVAMLAGAFAGDAFFELRPRVVRDASSGELRARVGAGRIAVQNAGVIPDRGHFGVFLAGTAAGRPSRVGELDEEMVFETAPGDVLVLGASSWSVVEITHDRVLVDPAPGEPGRAPFWKADRLGRPAAFGRAIGALARETAEAEPAAARRKLKDRHALAPKAAAALVAYLAEQKAATSVVPSDVAIVVERFPDELGDWRVVVHAPFGGRVHAPWCAVVLRRLRASVAASAEAIWTDDGMAFRLPASETPPDANFFAIDPDDVERLSVEAVHETQAFAARFRENAARALLLPRRAPGVRTPLWMQRKRALDLLAAAARTPNFPITLETVRDCLQDVFDIPELASVMRDVRSGAIRLSVVDTDRPSPFATNVLFTWTGSFLYDGDAASAERRSQALTLDHATLRELLGEADLRTLLDPKALAELERRWDRTDVKRVRDADDARDLLRRLGDLTDEEFAVRVAEDVESSASDLTRELLANGRALRIEVGGEPRLIATEDAALYRDALGVKISGVVGSDAFGPSVEDPLSTLLGRYARGRGPFTADEAALRFGIGVAPARDALRRLVAVERLVEGAFRPGGAGVEWCDAENLRALKAKSLAVGRAAVEPVDAATYARFLADRGGVGAKAFGVEGVFEAIERLEGVALPASVWFDDVFPSRVRGFRPWALDQLISEGLVVWRGAGKLGAKDGRVVFARADAPDRPPPPAPPLEGAFVDRVREVLRRRGASFFADLIAETGAFPAELLDVLWEMTWAGEVANDSTNALRRRVFPARVRFSDAAILKVAGMRRVKTGPLGSEGRWSLVDGTAPATPKDPTRRALDGAKLLLSRYGVVVRDVVRAEEFEGGFAALYPAFRALEERGVARRGYFVAGLGGAQFAEPGAAERLRAFRDAPETGEVVVLSAVDPAQPYGAVLPWPSSESKPRRDVGSRVALRDGVPLAWIARGGRSLVTFLPKDPFLRADAAKALARKLAVGEAPGSTTIVEVDGVPVAESQLATALTQAGFKATRGGFTRRFSSVDLPSAGAK